MFVSRTTAYTKKTPKRRGGVVLLADAPRGADLPRERARPEPVRGRSRETDTGLNVAIHGMRGIASMMVLLAHIIGGTARHIYPHDADYVRLITRPWNFGTFGVEIFFVVSGFVILPSAMRYSAGQFALRRLLRLYPLFFTLSLLFVALNHFTNAYPDLTSARSILAAFLFMNLFTGTEQLTPNAWSLSFEVAFYVLTALVVNAGVKRHSIAGGTAACLIVMAFLLAFPITIYFLIGVAMRITGREKLLATATSRTIEAMSLALLVVVASRAHFDYTNWAQFRDPTVPMIVALITTFFGAALMRNSLTAVLLDRRPFIYLGNVSYSLYLVHPFIYFAARAIFVHEHWFTDDVALSLICFSVVVVISSLLATNIVHRWLEVWPYEAFFHQRVYRTQARQGG